MGTETPERFPGSPVLFWECEWSPQGALGRSPHSVSSWLWTLIDVLSSLHPSFSAPEFPRI